MIPTGFDHLISLVKERIEKKRLVLANPFPAAAHLFGSS